MIDLDNVLQQVGDKLISFYRASLIQEGVNSTGRLSNSLSTVIQQGNDYYELCLRVEDYWRYVEEGREKGSFPSVQALKKWIRVKPVIPKPYNGKLPSIDSLAYLIGRKIERDGIEGKHLLEKALQQIDKTQLIEQQVDRQVRDEITIVFNELK